MERLFLIDAYALIFRAYYAFIARPMRSPEGLNTSAIFGFTKFLTDLIKRENPKYIGVAFDPHGGNFRNTIYPEYKANRDATPEDIIASTPYIKKILKAMHIPILEVAGYEADDVIGTLSHKAAAAGFEVFMVTPDKDFGQLVTPNISIYKQRKGGEGIDIIGYEDIKAKYGIDDPIKIIDILALWGDAADNIPGVMGIGEKTASKLVANLGTVEQIIENTDKLKGKQKENIEGSIETLKMAKILATISLDVPIEFNPDDLILECPNTKSLGELYSDLGFTMFLRELNSGRYDNLYKREGCQEMAEPETKEQAELKPAPSKSTTPLQGDLFAAMAAPIDTLESSAKTTNQQTSADLFQQALEFGSAEDSFSSIKNTDHKYHTINTIDELKDLIRELEQAERFCFDTETTGLDIFNSKLIGIAFSLHPFEAYYLPLNDQSRGQMLEELKGVFTNPKIEKIGHNIKFDINILRAAGLEVKGQLADTMIMHYLLDPERRHGMDYLARTILNYDPISIEELIGRGAKQITMDMVAVARVAEYAAEDADITMRLYEALLPQLKSQNLEKLYLTIEEPLIRVLADMEFTGVKIDSKSLDEYSVILRAEQAELSQKIKEICENPTLNIDSPKQLGIALFEHLKIADKPRKTKTGQYKTDEETLQSLSDKHPIVEMILEYRGLGKLLSTYIEALPQLINQHTQRIHTSYNQAVTATGRLSSNNPNLQNIPIREQRGRNIRKAFIPSDSEHILLAVDYSQVELRLMADLSGDSAMIEAFNQGEDIHSSTAAKLFGVDSEHVTSEMRRRAKTANFGIIYGISAFGLSQRLNIPRNEAKEIIDGYFASFAQVKSYMDNVIAEAKNNGYVETMFGRKRFLPDINSSNHTVRSLAERNAINAPIQGSAADIMKLAMIEVARRLEDGSFKSKITMQVHDELVLDTLKTEFEKVKTLVVEAMESAVQLKVKLIAEAGSGENWLEAH